MLECPTRWKGYCYQIRINAGVAWYLINYDNGMDRPAVALGLL